MYSVSTKAIFPISINFLLLIFVKIGTLKNMPFTVDNRKVCSSFNRAAMHSIGTMCTYKKYSINFVLILYLYALDGIYLIRPI